MPMHSRPDASLGGFPVSVTSRSRDVHRRTGVEPAPGIDGVDSRTQPRPPPATSGTPDSSAQIRQATDIGPFFEGTVKAKPARAVVGQDAATERPPAICLYSQDAGGRVGPPP